MRAWSWLTFMGVFAVACALFAPRMACAQSVNGIVGVPQRLEPNRVTSADNQGENPHPGSVPVQDINFEDCEADLVYSFQLLVTPAAGYNLDVWASTQGDCSNITNRQSSSTATCWPVITPTSNATVTPYTVYVRMQDIASQVFQTTKNINYTPATSDVCQLQTTTGSTALQLYFFYESAGNAQGTDAVYSMNVGLRAGDVQGDISAGVGDTLLIVNVPPTTDTSVQQWNVYCDPPPGQEGAAETVPVDAASNNGLCAPTLPDTGTPTTEDSSVDSSLEDGALEDSSVSEDSAVPIVLDDAGGNACGVPLNDAQIPSPGGCSASAVLVAGGCGTGVTSFIDDAGNTLLEEAGAATTSVYEEGGAALGCTGGNMVLIPPKYICGTSSATSTKINVLGLKDGYYYNIAVGAVDALGNVGPLSNVVCGEPVPVNDFWKIYYGDGGRAGGGFCSAEGVGTPAGTSGLGVITIASMVAIVRRRRRK